ncbi:hypothetical protein OAK19_02705 [Aureispira]|nr:hypothetical protein [Aureispira sp.]
MEKILMLLFFLFLSIRPNDLIAQGYKNFSFNTLSFGSSGVQHEDTLYFGDTIHVSFWIVNQGNTPIYDIVSIISNTYDINGTQIGWGTLSAGGNYYNTDSSLTVGDSILINITASVNLFDYVLGDNILEIWPAPWASGNIVDTSFTPIHILNSNPGGQIVYIPDINFKSFLISPWSGVNTNGDSEIQVSEATAYTFNLNVGMMNISDLTGIEAFINLTELSCYGNQLTNINLSQNTALTYLNCEDNQLTSLDLSQNAALEILNCENNQLTSLNLNGAIALGAVWGDYNLLTSLDLSTNINLELLLLVGNQLASLDVSQNPVLNRLDCEGQNWPNSQLMSLDLSQNPNLQWVNCSQNQLTYLNLNGAVSLETLYCSENQLTSLDLSTNTILAAIWCPNNQITFLDLTQNISTNGVSLACWDNALTNLDIRNGLNHTWGNMHCFNNPNLTCINVDDSVFMYNWMATSPNPPQVQIDAHHYFSNNCPSIILSTWDCIGGSCVDSGNGTGMFSDSMQCVLSCTSTDIINVFNPKNKTLIKIVDLLGRKTKYETNRPQFYIYDDGSVEKKIIIE